MATRTIGARIPSPAPRKGSWKLPLILLGILLIAMVGILLAVTQLIGGKETPAPSIIEKPEMGRQIAPDIAPAPVAPAVNAPAPVAPSSNPQPQQAPFVIESRSGNLDLITIAMADPILMNGVSVPKGAIMAAVKRLETPPSQLRKKEALSFQIPLTAEGLQKATWIQDPRKNGIPYYQVSIPYTYGHLIGVYTIGIIFEEETKQWVVTHTHASAT